jgi:hypothetical protein
MHTWHLTFATDGRNPMFPDEPVSRKKVDAATIKAVRLRLALESAVQ